MLNREKRKWSVARERENGKDDRLLCVCSVASVDDVTLNDTDRSGALRIHLLYKHIIGKAAWELIS